jgi:hypothetical protein
VRPEDRREELNVLRRPAQRRQAGGRYLDAPTDFVEVRSRVLAEGDRELGHAGRHEGATAGPGLGETERLQATQGFTNNGTAHPEPPRQLRFGWQAVVDLHLP